MRKTFVRWGALGLTVLALPVWGATELTFKGGRCLQDDAGSCAVEIGGQKLKFEVCWIDPRWGTPVIAGAMKASVSNEMLRLAFSARQRHGQALNKDHPMMLRVRGDASSHRTGRMQFGQVAKTFEKSCWSWGDRIGLQPHQAELRLSKALSMNYLIDKDGAWQMRLFFGGATTDGERVFEGAVTLAKTDVKVSFASDVIEQKRTQYGRILMPPQEKGLDTTRWRAVLAATNVTQKAFGQVEDLLDARSRLYSAAERLSCRPMQDAEGAALVAAGYAALNKMDLASATNACARLEKRLVGSEKWMPYGTFNPFNWVKCFTQWGYKRAPDGCSVAEPNPWLLQWEDDFRFSLAQDERVVIAHGKGNPRFYETRYLEPMSDVSFERSWVGTTWNLPGRRITFSVLTPIVNVEGVEALTLSGFSSEPRSMGWVNDRGQATGVRLVSFEEPPAEVVPSVLMDFREPPPPPKSCSRGEQKIDAAKMISPYFRVSGANWSLAFFPTARPVSVGWQKGVLTVRFDHRGNVGVMRLRDNVHGAEQAEVCEFFARTFLAYPIACRSTVANGVARWTYDYLRQSNAWGTERHVIAPVPPLLAYAEVAVPGSRGYKYPQKWGLFRYCEGTAVTCALPEKDLPREPVLRGVNVGLDDADSVWEAHITNGAHWVRAYFSGRRELDGHCERLEQKLRAFGKRIKFLVDPHCREYQVTWKAGMNPDPAVEGRFYALWDRLSKIGARYPHAVEGYDLYNEPGATAGSEERWRVLNEKAAEIIRRNHPGAKVYYSCVYGGNPNGLFNLQPLRKTCEPQVITYHFYSPHAFSHQKCSTHNRGNDTCVFYPGWSAPIDWVAGNHFGGTTVDWFDRWTLAAILLPAYEHYAQYRTPLHVGEFGVIGYANGKSPCGAFLWTRDAVELIEANGASWQIWNGGFGLGNRLTREYIYRRWREGNR